MLRISVVASVLVLLGVGMALADWFPGDGHKMHFPQMPDEAGWNVMASHGGILADDWQCSASGPVSDIHFWGSWYGGVEGTIRGFTISIYEDIPDPDPGDPLTYSQPGALLWSQDFDIGQVIVRQITPDPQVWEGWYNPIDGTNIYPDHDNYFQYNIFDIDDPFYQEQGTIYWISIEADVIDEQLHWGWKSSVDHFNDNAVFGGEITAGSCRVDEDGSGTVEMPAPCPFDSDEEVFLIIDGLPPGTTMELDGPLTEFGCSEQTPCSELLPVGTCEVEGGDLGGTVSCFEAELQWSLTGTGDLAGFTRTIYMPVTVEVHHGPRQAGDPVQEFAGVIVSLQGEIVGDPDFCYLTILAGEDYGLPCPGITTLTQLRGGDWNVDSFFDITYQIEFEGCPGSILEGYSGVTTGTIRLEQGDPVGSGWAPMDEPYAPQQVTNAFMVEVLPDGTAIGAGENAYGDGWYFYPEYAWWNIWFYDHPYADDRYKEVLLIFDIFPTGASSWAEIAVNWSTDAWSIDGNPSGERRPPLPGEGPEDLWIGRETIYSMQIPEGHWEIPMIIPNYNPEWVSIDLRGVEFYMEGFILHECVAQEQEPLDLAFVIADNANSCCLLRGDVNHDGVGPDIADLVYLVSYMFQNGPPPPCEEPVGSGYMPECDVNGDGVGPDIADLVYLVSYMFQQPAPAPVPCP